MASMVRSVMLALAVGMGMLGGLAGGAVHAQSTLVMMLRTGPELRLGEVRELVEDSLKRMPRPLDGSPIIAGKPIINQISALEYHFYNRLINANSVLEDDDIPLVVQRFKELELRQLLSAVPSWQIRYNGAESVALQALNLELKDGTTLTLKPDGKNLIKTESGAYTLKLLPGEIKGEIKSYKVAFEQIKGGETVFKFEKEWPKTDNYFRIRLNDFKGDRKRLERELTDPNYPNTLQDVKFGSDITIAVGEGQASDDEPDDIELRGNNLIVTVPPLRRGNPTRVWMLFPFPNKKAVDHALAEGKYADLTGKEVSDKIHSSLTKVSASERLIITKDMAPRWIELPKITHGHELHGLRLGRFGRVLPLAAEDGGAVKAADFAELLKSFPSAHRLIVYEYQDATTRTALKYKPGPEKKQGYVHESELALWSVLLNRVANVSAVPPK